jgi:predicted lipid-binding transport protein (Tim44 family)
MNDYTVKRSGLPAGNPIANVLVVIVGTILIAASIVVGFLAFIVVASIVSVLAAIIGLRVWWFKRKLDKNRPASKSSDAIEGEFVVVERHERRGD